MSRYFMRLAYNGAPFHGWQIQPGDISVQEVVEDALAKVLRRPTPVTGAGRTDTGVNASCMWAHFDTPEPLTDPSAPVRPLNAIVGRDIAIHEIRPVHDTAHARFDATSRTYHYYVHTVKSPFIYPHSWKAPATLDFEAMNRAAAMLLDVRDFTSFAKLHTDARTNICDVRRAEWTDLGDGRHVFVITADRFLRNMVRAVVGTLIDVGRHKIDLDGFARIISLKDRCAAGTSMPPHPLFLHEVTYPYI